MILRCSSSSPRGRAGRLHLSRSGAARAAGLGAARLPRRRLGRARAPAAQRGLSRSPAPLRRPLVLLDASLSMGAPGGRWLEARDSAARWGEVRRFGDERGHRHRSDPGPFAARARAHRGVGVGPAGHGGDRRRDRGRRRHPARSLHARRCPALPARPPPDLAITRVTGPARVTAGDSIPLEVEVRPPAARGRQRRIEAARRASASASRRARAQERSARGRLASRSARGRPGRAVLRVTLSARGTDGDAEPRTDTRLHLVTVAPTPGVVFLAAPGGLGQPVPLSHSPRGGAASGPRVCPDRGDRWRSMADLRPVPAETVRQAARRADLLILKGAPAPSPRERPRAASGAGPAAKADRRAVPGDWYLLAG